MTLEEIEQLEVELNKAKTETLLNAIDIYRNEKGMEELKKDVMKGIIEVFNNSFRMLEMLKRNVKRMEKSNSEELENKVLEIGEKYKNADKPTKIEVGKIMLGKRRKFKKKKAYR